MKTYTAEELKEVLEKHRKWRLDKGGECANLKGANLRSANLAGTNLKGADLEGADLAGTNLEGANLRCANLKGADLAGADLAGTNLRGAYLEGVKEIPIDMQNYFKKDLLYVLQNCPIKDVEQLKERIVNGKINGSQYNGECACLIGSLYQIEGLRNESEFAKSHIPYYGCGLHNPSEQLFWQIKEGDKPADNQFSKMALDVIEVYLNAK